MSLWVLFKVFALRKVLYEFVFVHVYRSIYLCGFLMDTLHVCALIWVCMGVATKYYKVTVVIMVFFVGIIPYSRHAFLRHLI